jgi:hypothetical protein
MEKYEEGEDQYSKPVQSMEGTAHSLQIDHDNSTHAPRHEIWTKFTGATYIDLPIYGLPQISIHPDNTSDTNPRQPYSDSEHQLPLPDHILKIYDFIWEAHRSTLISTTHCRMPTSANPAITGAISESKKYAFIECCGFSAAIMAAYLFIFTIFCMQAQTQARQFTTMDCFNNKYFEESITAGFTLTYKGENIDINNENIHEKLYMVFMLLSGYGYIYGIGWNTRCPMHTVLDQGINLVSLTGYPYGSRCDTIHHFIVYVVEEYCIIIDSWAGGIDGCRDPWIRIMKLDDMQRLINYINNLNIPMPPKRNTRRKIQRNAQRQPHVSETIEILKTKIRTEIFKNYFNAPNKLGRLYVDEPIYVGILNESSRLNDNIWKYLYIPESKGPSVLAGPFTQDFGAELDVFIDKQPPPSAPPPSPSPPPSASPPPALMKMSKGTGKGYTTKPKKTNKQNNKNKKKKTNTQKNK